MLVAPALLSGQQRAAGTSEVFRRYADRVVKVEITELGAAAKSSLGSGFFVAGDGLLVTNYHVVAAVVHQPERYRLRVMNAAGDTLAAALLAIDIVHDLAIVRARTDPPSWFELQEVSLDQGDRLYSLGHPRDLGLSIIEGTFNGLLRHTLYPKIHFSGSLNPGVSGGPAITPDGRVAGINVSTEGNQISFLVPVDRAIALLDRVRAAGLQPPDNFLGDAARQIRAYQDVYLTGLFEHAPTVTIGPYQLPTRPADYFRCWADADRDPDTPYESVQHYCSTDDYLYLSDDQWTGVVEMEHEVLTSTELNAVRFYALYQSWFDDAYASSPGDETTVTEFRCVTRNLSRTTGSMRAVICLRAYRKLDGLYDVVVRAAALGARHRGMISSLELGGVTYDNAMRVSRRFLESITWRRR